MKKFTRKIEDFICQHCGEEITGTGYTNHCPKCLWSKHVDINPGDRLNTCGGMMQPILVETNHGKYVLVHKCQKCGTEKRNKTSENDDMEAVIKLSKTIANS